VRKKKEKWEWERKMERSRRKMEKWEGLGAVLLVW